MAKTIVTHISPDLDGVGAIWLLKKFHPDFSDAVVSLVPAGQVLNGEPEGSNPDVVHVDTGGGRFDHHQTDDFTCAAMLVFEWLFREGYIDQKDDGLLRMINVICEIDHGWDNWKWDQRESDRYEFMLHNIMFGIKMVDFKEEEKFVQWTCLALDGIYAVLKAKAKAEKELANGKKFTTRWGRGIAVESGNGTILDLAIKKGFAVVCTKDPKKGNIRVTGSNAKNVDLTKAYDVSRERDSEATWFLHASKVLLRNGSTRNPTMKASKLTLEEMVKILEKA